MKNKKLQNFLHHYVIRCKIKSLCCAATNSETLHGYATTLRPALLHSVHSVLFFGLGFLCQRLVGTESFLRHSVCFGGLSEDVVNHFSRSHSQDGE